jgi:hypothetical protein
LPAFETKQVKFTRLALLPILMLGLSGTLLADSPSGQVKKLLPLLQTAKQDTRLQAVIELDKLISGSITQKLSLEPELLSSCISSVVSAIRAEKDDYLPTAQARCLSGLLAVSTRAEQDITAVLPILDSPKSDVVLYGWMGVGYLREQPLSEALREKLWSFIESPNQQVRLNALRWGFDASQLEKVRSLTALSPFQKRVWEKTLSSARSSDPRVATAAVRFLLPLANLDFDTVLNVLSQHLRTPLQDEEQIITLEGICEFAGGQGIDARQLSLPLQDTFKEVSKQQIPGAKIKITMALASLGPLPAEFRSSIRAEFKRPLTKDQLIYSAPGIACALAEAGHSEQQSISNMLRHASKIKGWRPRGLVDVIALTGVSADLAPQCIVWFKETPADEGDPPAGLLAAIGSSKSTDPQVVGFLLKQLSHKDYFVQLSAAYALTELGSHQREVASWVQTVGLAKGYNVEHPGLLLAILRSLKIHCSPPQGFVADTVQKATLLHLIEPGHENAKWSPETLLVNPRLPVRWMRCGNLADTQATLTLLKTLAEEAPRINKDPNVLRLLKYSPNPEVVEAADRAYQAVWPVEKATPK